MNLCNMDSGYNTKAKKMKIKSLLFISMTLSIRLLHRLQRNLNVN